MRILSVFLVAILMGTGLRAEEAYYTGSHLCERGSQETLRWDEWRITFGDSGPETAHVLYREQGQDRYSDRSGPLLVENGTFILERKKGRPWVAFDLAQDRETLDGFWIDALGRPHKQCRPFTLHRTTPPVERIDALLDLYETSEPTVDDFVSAARQRDAMPPLDLLPALDRQAYQDRLSEDRPAFEARFREAQAARIEAYDMADEADREALTAQTRTVVSPSLREIGAFGDRAASADYLRLFYRGADRLAGTGELGALPLDPGEETCAAIRSFGPSWTMEEIEMLVGLPFEYWDRPLAERVLSTAETCKARSLVGALTRQYPEIEGRAATADWLRDEVARITVLPATFETLRDNDWLSLENDGMTISSYQYERFAGLALEDFRRDALADTLERVRAGYSGSSAGASAAEEICRQVPTSRDARTRGLYDALREACRDGRRAMAEAEERLQCDRAVLDSGLDEATDATHLYAPAVDSDPVALREWLCEMAGDGGFSASFDGGGGFGPGLSLTARFESRRGTVAFRASLEAREDDDTVLEVTEIEAVEMMEGAKLDVPEEGAHVCLFVPRACVTRAE